MTEKAAQSKADYTIICLRLRVVFMWFHAITTIFICNKLTVRSLLNHWISRVFRTKGFPFSNAQILRRHLLSIFRTYKAENILTMLSGLHRLKKPANSRCSARNLVLPSLEGAGGGSAISLSPPPRTVGCCSLSEQDEENNETEKAPLSHSPLPSGGVGGGYQISRGWVSLLLHCLA